MTRSPRPARHEYHDSKDFGWDSNHYNYGFRGGDDGGGTHVVDLPWMTALEGRLISEYEDT